MFEFYCKKDDGCHFQKPETQLAGPSMGAHVCNFSGSCEHQRDAKQLYHGRLLRLSELSYEQLCALKQECIHTRARYGLGEIEKALAMNDEKAIFRLLRPWERA